MTKKSDVFSLAVVIVELVAGNIPFLGSLDLDVISMVLKGKIPPEPRRFNVPGMAPAVWKIVEKERPEANAIFQDFEEVANLSAPTKNVSVHFVS
ncbi:hypothetical protein BDM02DRAFT_3121098 [Thelephora ganbajun]|uniref:Uncharacterized protein n=1 Tax=Thelephora ganbajun TaxID=370292 RepID=A0ACB6Z6H8_THEGA|nr:hypothetical protein BDM02DRAFT_3121098 [Thelephora ganbajun]